MITLDQYLQGRHLTYAKEWHPSVAENAKILLQKVNALITDLQLPDFEIEVVSGWRPESYNKLIGGSPHSYHVKGMAVDLSDDQQYISNAILKDAHLLARYELWMENPKETPSWCHLDIGTRPERQVRVFMP